ncbi:hypothetical protein EKD04_023190 [Chloroflexales bacterium ZM16-3]|nr:hypothetical protein [Chloroflexales bacterium ZM16-3]
MPGLSAGLLKKLRRTLLDCGPFTDHRALSSVFVDDRISPWKSSILSASSANDRVGLFVGAFLGRSAEAGAAHRAARAVNSEPGVAQRAILLLGMVGGAERFWEE